MREFQGRLGKAFFSVSRWLAYFLKRSEFMYFLVPTSSAHKIHCSNLFLTNHYILEIILNNKPQGIF